MKTMAQLQNVRITFKKTSALILPCKCYLSYSTVGAVILGSLRPEMSMQISFDPGDIFETRSSDTSSFHQGLDLYQSFANM
jgi:hypothetical protein